MEAVVHVFHCEYACLSWASNRALGRVLELLPRAMLSHVIQLFSCLRGSRNPERVGRVGVGYLEWLEQQALHQLLFDNLCSHIGAYLCNAGPG